MLYLELSPVVYNHQNQKDLGEKKKKKAGPGTKLMSVEAIIAHSD